MRISTSLAQGFRQDLQVTTTAIARSLERLSTGKRVNSSKDDSYAYRLGVTLQSQIRGVTQANLNANTAMGIVETADGALETQLDILQQLRQLAVEASSTTLTSVEREGIGEEVYALMEEFRRITADTEFDGAKLLDGSFGSKAMQVGSNFGNRISVDIGSIQASSIFQKNVGTGTFASRTTVTSAANPYGVALADFNQDGKLDIAAVASTSAVVQIYDGKGDGTFLAPRTYTVGTTAQEIRAGDVTGDGIVDLVVGDAGTTTISILAGNGDGTFDTRITLGPGSAPTDIELADVNDDGSLDIVTTISGSAQVGVYKSNGDGTFQTVQTYTVGTTPVAITSGDVNGDGNVDLLVANSGSANVSVLFGSSTGTFTTGTTLTVGTAPSGMALFDMDLDGDLDIAVSNGTTNNVTIATNSGVGVFTVTSTLTAGTKPEDIRAADLNKDGYQDLFVLNEDTRNISLFLASGAATFGSATTLSLGGTSTFGAFEMALGDLNGDGVVDIVAPQTGNTTATDGTEVGILLANRTSTSAEGDVKVNTAEKAQDLLAIIDTAIDNINEERNNLAAVHSRLQSAYAANLLLIESYSDAYSEAVDADIAIETAELTRNQVQQQAQIAVLAQANVQLQTALRLIEG
jgi:flagellin-like hook-associated protein FlgL